MLATVRAVEQRLVDETRFNIARTKTIDPVRYRVGPARTRSSLSPVPLPDRAAGAINRSDPHQADEWLPALESRVVFADVSIPRDTRCGSNRGATGKHLP